MTKTAKIGSIAVLTFFLFGLSFLLQEGRFIVPTPFVPEFIFVMTLVCLIQFISHFKLVHFLLALFALFGVLSGRFIWELSLSFDQLVYIFEETLIIEIFKILQFSSLIALLYLLSRSVRSKIFFYSLLAQFLFLVLVLGNNDEFLLSIWYTFFGVLCSIFSIKRSFLTTTKNNELMVVELFIAIGTIHLLSLVSIFTN